MKLLYNQTEAKKIPGQFTLTLYLWALAICLVVVKGNDNESHAY